VLLGWPGWESPLISLANQHTLGRIEDYGETSFDGVRELDE
jgi:hypothetical protein